MGDKKMKKIAICTPIGRAGIPQFHDSLNHVLFSGRPGYQVACVQDVGHANTPRIRNVLAQTALDYGFDVIFFIDDDISFDSDVFWEIIDDPAPICGVAPRTRTNSLDEVVFGYYPTGELSENRKTGKLATAFMKIEASVLRDLEPHTDWFNYNRIKSEANPEGVVRAWFDYEIGDNPDGKTRGYIGEDYWFCNLAIKHGYEPVIRTDLGVSHWHMIPLTGRVADYA